MDSHHHPVGIPAGAYHKTLPHLKAAQPTNKQQKSTIR